MKKKVIENLIENAKDQSQESTIVEFASAFDLRRKIAKETRIGFIRNLYRVYGKEKRHEIDDVAYKGDFKDYTIEVVYPPKLTCTEKEIVDEFNSLWPSINRKWVTFKNSKPAVSLIKRFWNEIVGDNAIDYPNLSDLVLLLFSVSPGTGPIERSFSKLAKICYKDRASLKPSTLESLYLLSAMDIDGNDEKFCKQARNCLQKPNQKQ